VNNIETAFVLIRAESDRRIKDGNHHDCVGTVYELMMEVSAKCDELMRIQRKKEQEA
jgi:hypothetical protein